MLSTMCKDLSRREQSCQMLGCSIKTITKITATVKPLISTVSYKQKFKQEKSTSSLNVLFFPMEEGQLHQGRWESNLTGKTACTKGSCCFMDPVGRRERRKRVTGNVLTMEPGWSIFFKTSEGI